MQPVVISAVGTAVCSTIVIPDYMQNPFQISVACILGSAAGTFSIQHSLDFPTVYAPSFNGATALLNGRIQTATWFNNSGITDATTSITGNYAFPVAAIRLNITSGLATTQVTAIITQATNAP